MNRTLASELQQGNLEVMLEGWVHRLRDLGKVRFIILRDRTGLSQIVLDPSVDTSGIGGETVVRVWGKSRVEPRAKSGFEVYASKLEILSPAETPPLELFKPENNVGPEALLNMRAFALRIPDIARVFKVQAAILQAFRDSLDFQGFTEIISPKLVLAGAEGGSALFEVKYYDGLAYLSQSPQFYKQIMVGVYERVFEVGHAYRAEKSETTRHLTEFVSLDAEAGFIESELDIIKIQQIFLSHLFDEIAENFGLLLPSSDNIPVIDFQDAKRLLAEKGKVHGVVGDLDSEGERMLGEIVKEKFNSEFVYVTGYAANCRPFYTMATGERSHSFDLLYNGVEISTGGQRIHKYADLISRMESLKMDPAKYEDYLLAFRHGMPPHGGFGMGLERLTKQILGLSSVKEASLFPRDCKRLRP